jgi:uncharacterized protein (DUF1697 family)
MRYVALLRGINVGGRRPVKMAELQAAFDSAGFTAVRTVQASGNVVFEAADEYAHVVTRRIEEALDEVSSAGDSGGPATNRAGMAVLVRRLSDLRRLVDSEPFGGVPIEPATRLYVTFLAHPAKTARPAHPKVNLVKVTEEEVLTAITLSPDWGTTDLMAWLEREFGPGVTTRNWNTVVKIASG